MNGHPVHNKHMDIDKLKEFTEAIEAVNELNGEENKPNYLSIMGDKAYFSDYLSFYNLYGFDYLIAFGGKSWKSATYTNYGEAMLGMVDKNFEPVTEIPLKNGYSIKNIRFTTYGSSWYNTFKPILVIVAPDGTQSELRNEEENGMSEDLVSLIEKANALKFTPKPAEE